MWKSPESRSTGNPATSGGASGYSESHTSYRGDRPAPVRINRAQLLIGGAVAFVLAGTTAFVFLREAVPPTSPAPEVKQTPSQQAANPTPVQTAAPAPAPAPSQPTAIQAPPAPVEQAAVPPPQQMSPPKTEPATVRHAVRSTKPAPQAPIESTGTASEPPAPTAGAFTLQLGSFLVPENAAGLIDRMGKRGDQASEKLETDANGKAWHKVRAGSYATLSDAQTAADELKRTENIDALIVETVREGQP